MAKNRWNQKINFHLLNRTIKARYKSKSEFARRYGFKIKELINWTLGISSPGVKDHFKLVKILDLEPFDLLLPPGVDLRKMKEEDLEVERLRFSIQVIFGKAKPIKYYEEMWLLTKLMDLDKQRKQQNNSDKNKM